MVVEEIVGIFHNMGVVNKLRVETIPIEVEEKLVRMVLRLVEVENRVVIRLISMLFCLILKWKLLVLWSYVLLLSMIVWLVN